VFSPEQTSFAPKSSLCVPEIAKFAQKPECFGGQSKFHAGIVPVSAGNVVFVDERLKNLDESLQIPPEYRKIPPHYHRCPATLCIAS
jgi:hypothetical protein